MGSGRRTLIVGIMLSVFSVAFQSIGLATAIPTVMASFDAAHLYPWAFTTMVSGMLLATIVSGRVADTRGPAAPMYAGFALFAVGLLLGWLAPNVWVVLAARAVQGLGAEGRHERRQRRRDPDGLERHGKHGEHDPDDQHALSASSHFPLSLPRPHAAAYHASMTELAPGSQTVLDERTQQFEDGDQDRFSHYVPKDKLIAAMVNGTPVVALCGKVWVPTKNPDKFPVCPDCKEIWQSLNPGR